MSSFTVGWMADFHKMCLNERGFNCCESRVSLKLPVIYLGSKLKVNVMENVQCQLFQSFGSHHFKV